ncbi:MAG TPA: urease accessory UreF family protein [Vicinamibacterales bacterium]
MDAIALLRLQQLFDSQLPVGAFAHSGGVETYAALGGGLAELRDVLEGQIALGWGRSDLAAAYLAWEAADRDPGIGDSPLLLLARELDALKVVPAVRNASVGLGRRTLELLRRLYPFAAVEVEPSHQAVIVGAAAARLGIEARELLLAYAQSLALGTLAAGLRCMPVSPAQAQGLLADVHPEIARAVEGVLQNPQACLFTCTPMIDIRSHQQAFLRTRLFQS